MSTTITRHPDDANLMSYAAGALPEPLAAAVAAHAALCPTCRLQLRDLRSLGGVLLDDVGESQALPPDTIPELAMLGPVEPAGPGASHSSDAAALMPQTIVRRYGLDLNQVPWRWLAPGVRYFPLTLSPGVIGDLRLLKIAPGRKMPEHGHGGCEMTLVLDGAYSDETGTFHRGDIQDVDGELEHQPIVDARAGCICLVAAERPARFNGIFGRLLQPWTGM